MEFLSSVTEEFGHSFVSRALGYITAARYGLSEVELLDLLASDREVSDSCVKEKKDCGRGKKKKRKKKSCTPRPGIEPGSSA